MLRNDLIRYVFSILLLVLFLGHAGQEWNIPFTQSVDAYLYDARVRAFAGNTQDDRVVVVDIDEKSLQEVGHWPWGRDKVAALIQRLVDEYHVAVIGFDVVFAEADDQSGLKTLESLASGALQNNAGYQESLKNLRSSLDYDQRFADVLKGRPVVLGYYFSDAGEEGSVGQLPDPVFPPGTFPDYPGPFVQRNAFGANLPLFQEAAGAAGHFMPLTDSDGITRRVPLLVEHKGAYYEALSLAMVRHLLGKPAIQPGFPGEYGVMEWLDLLTPGGAFTIPVDRNVAALIPYRGDAKSFPYISAADVLNGRVAPEQLAGKIVLVGTTAPGLNDLRATPVSGIYPGVEIHANLIAGMLDGKLLEHPGYLVAFDLFQVGLVGLLLIIFLPRLSPVKSTLLTFVLVSGVLGGNLYLWENAQFVVPLAGVLIMAAALYVFNMSWGYFVESRSKRQFTELFGQYVPPELVDEMAKNPEHYSMDGRNADLTVLFSDVRSFTTISEGMEPQALAAMMNAYLGSMTEVIRDRKGTLDKYIGDAIMAFWGAPVPRQTHPEDAVLAALEMQAKLKTLAEPFQERGWPALQIGVGVNTGQMTVGDMGSRVRRAYTVMGDAVNVGARLEGLTKEYGVGILVGESTEARVPTICFREIDRLRVKGKDLPLVVYEPLCLISEVSDALLAELSTWSGFLEAYRGCQWDVADAAISALIQGSPKTKLYEVYKKRVEALRLSPPPADWDGVTTFKTK